MPHQKRPGTLPFSAYLAVIVLVTALPVFGFSAMLVSSLLKGERAASEQLLQKTADEVALAFDQEAMATVRVLEALGASDRLARGEFRAFHAELQNVLRSEPRWFGIRLHRAADAEFLLDAKVPYGAPLESTAEPESLRRLIAEGKPQVGRLISRVAGVLPMFPVRVPVRDRAGQIRYVLTAVIPTSTLQQLVARFTTAPGEFARALGDQTGTIGARSVSPEKFVGGKFSQSLMVRLHQESGVFPTRTLEGVQVFTGYRRAPFSGWYAAIAVPAQVFEAGERRATKTILGMALATLLLTVAVAYFFSVSVRRSLAATAHGAAALSRGEEPRMGESRIREIAALKDSLLAASTLLRSRDRAKSEFLANMSHELRTPLGIVLGTTDLLEKEMVAPADRPKSWEILRRNGQQLRRLIDDILDFSKIEANRLVVENVDFSVADLVSAVAEDFAPRLRDKNVELRFAREDGAPGVVHSDPVRVRQILANLVGNAAKFTHAGVVEVKLHPYANGVVRLTVTDSGIGLTEAQQGQLFHDFTQGDSSHTRKYGGTGLGLSLSRKLARLLGGEVRLLRSAPGRGSSFEITFRAEPGKGQVVEERREVAPRKIRTGTRILLAEDSPDNVFWIEGYLKELGAEVAVAENGVEAVEKARAQEFDLILMDIQMPDMDGYEATRRIREEGSSVPIIALTAHALTEHRARALQLGFTDFLSKPVQHEALLKAVEKNLLN